MPSPEAAVQRLQLLADALAAEFSQSQASAECAAALARLLPGMEYLSIAVSNPAQGGSIVASSNCAMEGPTTLHLHDPLTSAAGRALALGKPVQLSLLDGGGAAVLSAWTDVQQMMASAPGTQHLLCVPFAGTGGEEGEAGCRRLHRGSGRGALLFGFAAAPELDARRKAVLAALAHCLPAPMAQMSADTLAFVNFACGSHSQCSCCCGTDDEEEEEAGSGPESNCRDGDRGQGSGGGAAPSQALRVPGGGPRSGAAAGLQGDAAGPSSRPRHPHGDEKAYAKARAAADGSAAAAALPPLLPGARPGVRFSKALLAAAEGQGEGLVAQSPFTLTFLSALMEQEYGQWIVQHHIKSDLLFSLLLLMALTIVGFIQPYRLVDHSPVGLMLGAGLALPLLLNCLARSLYTSWRERLAVVLRLYVVAFINLVSIRSYQSHLPHDRLDTWITFWMLTGAESLAVSALGFPIRLQLHLPLQFAAMGVASWNIPRMCTDAQCYPGVEAGACFKSSAAMAALFGYVLPTAGLRYMEQRSRALFAGLLRSAAAHED